MELFLRRNVYVIEHGFLKMRCDQLDKNKCSVIYFISVFIFIVVLSNQNRAYHIAELSFIIPTIIISLSIGVLGVYFWGKDMKLYKNIYFISYVLSIGFTFVPRLSLYEGDAKLTYGFPAQWFEYYTISGGINVNVLSFIFNLFFFFLILFFLKRLILKLLSSVQYLNNV